MEDAGASFQLGHIGLPMRGAAIHERVLQLMTKRVHTDPDLNNWLKRRDMCLTTPRDKLEVRHPKALFLAKLLMEPQI